MEIAVAAPGQTGISARPASVENCACVTRRGRERNVADYGGDAEDSRPVMRAGVEQRKRIVDASIDVKDERLCELGHEGNLLLGLMRPR